jgi:uncharacterized membrane protein HdeD (DUF308 family)
MALFENANPDVVTSRNAVLADNWWAVALRGLFAILFGIVSFAMPGAAMLALALIFGAYSIADGIFNIVLAVRGARKHERWGLFLVNGLLGILIGIIAAIWPGITVLAFVFMVGAWALLSGGLMFGAALGMKISHGRWWLVFGAIISMIYGLLLFASPLIGALVFTWWVGAYALVFGVTLIVLASRLRRHRGERIPGAFAAPI